MDRAPKGFDSLAALHLKNKAGIVQLAAIEFKVREEVDYDQGDHGDEVEVEGEDVVGNGNEDMNQSENTEESEAEGEHETEEEFKEEAEEEYEDEFEDEEEDNYRDKGEGIINIWGIWNTKGQFQYVRSCHYQGEDSSRFIKVFTFEPTLIRDDESVFDIGRLVEKLLNSGFLNNRCKLSGTFMNHITKKKSKVNFALDDLVEDGYTNLKEILYDEYWIITNSADEQYKVLGTNLDSVKNDPLFWNKITTNTDWVVYKNPVQNQVISFHEQNQEPIWFAQEICRELSGIGNEKLLEQVLAGANVWDEDFLYIDLLTTQSGVDRSDIIIIKGEENIRHAESAERFVEYVIRTSPLAPWQFLSEPPSDQIEGIWPLDSIGNSALMLTTDKGFFSTDDGGALWKSANFNENGFSDGNNVKTFVLDKGTIYALIDRGESNADNDNPLYKLEKRNWVQRWRAGLIQLLE